MQNYTLKSRLLSLQPRANRRRYQNLKSQSSLAIAFKRNKMQYCANRVSWINV